MNWQIKRAGHPYQGRADEHPIHPFHHHPHHHYHHRQEVGEGYPIARHMGVVFINHLYHCYLHRHQCHHHNMQENVGHPESRIQIVIVISFIFLLLLKNTEQNIQQPDIWSPAHVQPTLNSDQLSSPRQSGLKMVFVTQIF